MDSGETARAVIRAWDKDGMEDYSIDGTWPHLEAAVATALQAAVQDATGYSPLLSCCRDAKAHVEHRVTDAVKAERERCAKIAESLEPQPDTVYADTGAIWRHTAGRNIAAAIRREEGA